MLKKRNLISFLIAVAIIFTSVCSTFVVFAEDEDEGLLDETTIEENEELQTEDSANTGYKGLVAHWKFDGDIKDSTQFKNDGEAVGGKTGVTYVNSVDGKGVKLDGKSYIKVKDSTSLDLKDSFTFSFWVYKEDMRKNGLMDGGVPYIIKNEEYGDFPYGVYEWGELTPAVTYNDGSSVERVDSEKQVDIQKWSLISATYDGETMKIYIDKELVKSELVSTSLINSNLPLYIGFGHFMTIDNYFKGVLDDMRIYNTALSYSEIEDLYENIATKNPGKDLINKPNRLVAYYQFENNLKDSSSFKNEGKAVKASNFKYVNAIAGKGVKFSGASYIEVKDNDSLDLDRGFTIGTWIYKEKSNKNQPIFAKYGESHDKNACSYDLVDWNNGTRLSLFNFINDGNTNQFETDESNDTANGRWFYYTATYNGKDNDAENKDSNTVKLYINGKLVKTEEFDGDISNSSGPLWLGGTTDSIFFKGIMDEFRIYNYALTPTEVKTLYSMKDGLEVVTKDNKAVPTTLSPKKKVQLNANLLTHKFTSPNSTLPNGKDELKKQNVSAKATYKSNNAKVVTVSKAGLITAVGKGKAVVTVTYGTFSKNISITVK